MASERGDVNADSEGGCARSLQNMLGRGGGSLNLASIAERLLASASSTQTTQGGVGLIVRL